LSIKVKRVWKRLNWELEDICELRDRITLNVLLLSTFLGGILRQLYPIAIYLTSDNWFYSQIITEAKRGVD
jgi:hypothetical protein